MGVWPWLLLMCLVSSGKGQVSFLTTTREATTITHGSGLYFQPAMTITFKDTTLTEAATSSVRPEETVTRSAQTLTLVDVHVPGGAPITDISALADIANFASTLTSLAPSEVTQVVSDLEAYYTSLQADTPYIIYKVPNDLLNAQLNNSLDDNTYTSVSNLIYNPWNVSNTPEVASLLTGNPSLLSEVQEFMSVGKTFLASSLSVVGSIITKDLSLTGPPPTWVSEAQAATASLATATMTTATATSTPTNTVTSTSTGGVAPTAMPNVLLNVGALAAGVAVLAGL